MAVASLFKLRRVVLEVVDLEGDEDTPFRSEALKMKLGKWLVCERMRGISHLFVPLQPLYICTITMS
jgi:hypothetical protein